MADTFTGTTPTGGTFSSASEWYDQYLADLASLGGALAQEEYVPYGGPRLAEFTPDQQAAFARVRDSMDMWKPYVDPALESMYAGQGGLTDMANMVRDASSFDRPTYENTFYDIYKQPMEQMQQAARDIGARNFQNTTLKQLSDAFGGTGQFGSGRHQILGADAAAYAQAQIEEAAASVGMQATQNAMNDYLKWQQQLSQSAQQMGNYASNQARMGTDLMNFGLGTQQAALSDAAAIGSIGSQQQYQNQQNLDTAYQDFLTQQNYPWQQLSNWTSIANPSYVPRITTPTVTPQTYQNPWASALQGTPGSWQLGSAFS